jgi:hypothetical protein
VAQVFRPSLDASSTTWQATRVFLRLRLNAVPDGSFRISLVGLTSANIPGSTVYASVDGKESSLSGGARTDEFTFPTCLPIPAGQAVAIVVEGISGASISCDLMHLVSATPTMPFNLWRASTTNGGGTWTGYGQSQNCVFQIYGNVTTETR